MLIKAVIFDMGGVLMRTEDQTPREKLAARLGLSRKELYRLIFDNESARLATIGKMTSGEHWEAVREALKLGPDEFSSVYAEFWEGDSLDEELINYIRSLRPRYKTALLSNAWDDLRQILNEEWKIMDAFDEIIISAEVGLAKPDPRIYRLAADRLDVAPSEAVFVDDFIENIEAAREYGLKGIHFQNVDQARQELDRLLGES